jgi:hypothetical protein
MKVVDEAEWDLSGMRDRDRAKRLLRAMRPEDLIDRVAHEAMDGETAWRWQPGELMVGCGRVIMVIPLTVDTFDDLINGRCGYRAQYYLSVGEGRQFNDTLVASLCAAANQIFEREPKSPGWKVVEQSIRGPYSKVGVHGDSGPFDEAPQGEFLPHQWAHRGHTIWMRAPRPKQPAIELKGAWLDDKDRSPRLDPCKEDRDQVYHECGGA